MKNHFTVLSRLPIMLLAAFLLFAAPACKNKQKIAAKEAAEARARKIAEAKAALNALLNDTSRSLEDKERELNRIKAMNLNDPEVNALIAQVERKLQEEREAKARAKAAEEEARRKQLEEEERRRRELEEQERNRNRVPTLPEYFDRIATASSLSQADGLINDALKLFSSPETPVLIIISTAGGEKDYDRPTTIKRYLEYLKDQKRNLNRVENVLFDSNGKIRELELIRK